MNVRSQKKSKSYQSSTTRSANFTLNDHISAHLNTGDSVDPFKWKNMFLYQGQRLSPGVSNLFLHGSVTYLHHGVGKHQLTPATSAGLPARRSERLTAGWETRASVTLNGNQKCGCGVCFSIRCFQNVATCLWLTLWNVNWQQETLCDCRVSVTAQCGRLTAGKQTDPGVGFPFPHCVKPILLMKPNGCVWQWHVVSRGGKYLSAHAVNPPLSHFHFCTLHLIEIGSLTQHHLLIRTHCVSLFLRFPRGQSQHGNPYRGHLKVHGCKGNLHRPAWPFVWQPHAVLLCSQHRLRQPGSTSARTCWLRTKCFNLHPGYPSCCRTELQMLDWLMAKCSVAVVCFKSFLNLVLVHMSLGSFENFAFFS